MARSPSIITVCFFISPVYGSAPIHAFDQYGEDDQDSDEDDEEGIVFPRVATAELVPL
ncbi:hypothetical protein B0H19DRAFT_1264678 [Mycena capillaripes]|nr:hypothetical protein B0H19DRAFT_1264678 [Mycena capillaripes]